MPTIEIQIHTAQLQLLQDCLMQAIARGTAPMITEPHGDDMALGLVQTIQMTLDEPVPGALHSLCDTFPVSWEPGT